MFLRIAPELYLKRLVVGGFDRVYEINRNFRNEGISTQHNPEFTMLEFYQAYANYKDLIALTQELIAYVAKEVNGTTVTHFNGVEIDLAKWRNVHHARGDHQVLAARSWARPELSDFDNPRAFRAFVVTASRIAPGNATGRQAQGVITGRAIMWNREIWALRSSAFE